VLNNEPTRLSRDVRFTPEFKRNLRQLAKKYRHIRSDIQPIIDALEQGELPGDQVPGVGVVVYKVRVRNSDAQRGKSGGYRMIYYQPADTMIVLITLYSKTEQADIELQEIQAILAEAAAVVADETQPQSPPAEETDSSPA
jgi:mRNA-degrading endonuclease RelE of RelBE toxin-antitoxin system